MERGYVVNMDGGHKCRTLMGPPYGTMDGGQIWPTVQYGWSEGLVNMPIHTRCDLRGETQIEVTPGNCLENQTESMRGGSHE